MTTVYYTFDRRDLFVDSDGFDVEATASKYEAKCRDALWSIDDVTAVEVTDLGDGFFHDRAITGIVVDDDEDGEIQRRAVRALEDVEDFYVTIRYEIWECADATHYIVEPNGVRRPARLHLQGRAATAMEALVIADGLDPENGDISWGHRALVWDEDEERFLGWEETEALRASAEYPDAEFFERATA
jgi:hypothetical protein